MSLNGQEQKFKLRHYRNIGSLDRERRVCYRHGFAVRVHSRAGWSCLYVPD